jgi:pyridoxal phosphate enzyme (YggS family)
MLTPERARQLEVNWNALLGEIDKRAQLLVVSKTQKLEEIRYLFQLGQRDFGENRVKDLEERAQALSDLPGIRWHLIGNLQSNKIPKLSKIPGLTAIHSVSSLELLQKLQAGLKVPMGIFLQVNTSREDEKSGFENVDEIQAAARLVQAPLRLQGLMTMATIRTDDVPGEARRCFRELKVLRDRFDPRLELSMGMSGDYGIALEEGSSWVRVGSRVFATSR